MTARQHVGGRDLVQATLVGAGLIVLVAVALAWRHELFVLVVLAVVIAAYIDMDRAVRLPIKPVRSVSLLASCVLLPATFLLGATGQVAGIATLLGATVIWLIARDVTPARLATAAVTVFAGIWIILLASFALIMLTGPNGQARLAVTIAAVALADIGGYAIGVPFGRHKLSARLSPNKTREGVAGAVVAGAVGAGIAWPVVFAEPSWRGVMFGAVIGVAGIAGDIAESGVKRAIGVKDLGRFLPGHGGVLDRVDGLLFALPVATLLFSVL